MCGSSQENTKIKDTTKKLHLNPHFNRKPQNNRALLCMRATTNIIRKKGQRMGIKKNRKSRKNSIEKILYYLCNVRRKKKAEDISVSDDLWNTKLTFIGRSLLNPDHGYIFAILCVALHFLALFPLLFTMIVVNWAWRFLGCFMNESERTMSKKCCIRNWVKPFFLKAHAYGR